jgi:hypothetical protein
MLSARLLSVGGFVVLSSALFACSSSSSAGSTGDGSTGGSDGSTGGTGTGTGGSGPAIVTGGSGGAVTGTGGTGPGAGGTGTAGTSPFGGGGTTAAGGSGTAGTTGKGGSGTAGSGMGTGGTGAGGTGAQQDCSTTATQTDCITCCDNNFNGGYGKLVDAVITQCGCTAGAKCNSACGMDMVCTDPNATMIGQACIACLNMVDFQKDACGMAVAKTCTADPDCIGANQCTQASMCSTKPKM